MLGSVDFINRNVISGWVFGDLEQLSLIVDGIRLSEIVFRRLPRPDVNKVYPDKASTGFQIESPKEILDGRAHSISVMAFNDHLENSPKKFRFLDNKVLFIHAPKTGGTSVIESLRYQKSLNGEDHIQKFGFSPVVEKLGSGGDSLVGRFDKIRLQRRFKNENIIDKSSEWLAGHVTPLAARKIINEYLLGQGFKNYQLSFFSDFNYHNKSEMAGFGLYSLVRNPIDQLISHLNWFHEIFFGRDPSFLFAHPIDDIGKISFYIRNLEKSIPSTLSKLINLKMLNYQSRHIAPRLVLDPQYKTAINCLKGYRFVGRLESIDLLIRKITYDENEWPVTKANITNYKYYTWNDFDPYLKDFIHKKMDSDFLLYEAVKDRFG